MKNLNLSSIKNIIIVVLFIITITFSGLYFNKKYDYEISNQNYYAAVDSLRTTQNKLGEIVYEKNMYVLSIEELEKENSNLYNDIKKLSTRDRKNLVEISKLNTEIGFLKDSINQKLDTTSEDIKFLFDLTNEYRKLSGYTLVSLSPLTSSLYIEEDKIFTDLTISKIKTDKGFELNVSSTNPYLKINNIEGSIVNIDAYQKSQKQKHWGLGVSAGIGATYGLINKNIDVGPTISITINYNFITW